MTKPVEIIGEINKALSHAVRLRMVAMLRGGPLCVCQVTAVVKLAASTVSAHLAELKRAGIVLEQKSGRWVEYRLAEAGPHVAMLAAVWPALESDPRIKADERILRELRKVSLEELCQVDLDLNSLGRPKLEKAVAAAEEIAS
jgi:ArsR family transcriptional regulator, arsenate/arsenite/antimonite-responsive transcriptional repressor